MMSKELKKINYFEFYELPVQFNPDQNAIKAKFYALSKQYHPDFYANASNEKQQEVLELSTLNNEAYQTLSNPKKLLKYVLMLKEVIKEDEAYQLPQSFLMEMMDVNETLMDLQLEPNADKLTQVSLDIKKIEETLDEKLRALLVAFDESTASSDTLLPQIKDVYYRQKYVARLKERLS